MEWFVAIKNLTKVNHVVAIDIIQNWIGEWYTNTCASFCEKAFLP
jgi:hypothetical protein